MMQRIKIIGMIGAVAMGLAGCNVTEQSLQPIPGDPPAPTDNAASMTPGGVDPLPGATNQAPGPQSPVSLAPGTPQGPGLAQASLSAGQVRGQIRFTPVIGAPVNAVTPLSRQLAVEARNRGLAILSASAAGGDHVLKGYFSADNFEGQTTVFYVWDILDTAGTRLTRIQGQEAFPGGSGDPWASVPADVMERIATRTLSDYAAWRGL
jgi:hypothetical protein